MALPGSKGVATRPAEVKPINTSGFNIILKEGKKRQIRRMVQALNNEVMALKRIRIGHIHIGRLGLGQWRFLNDSERQRLLRDLAI